MLAQIKVLPENKTAQFESGEFILDAAYLAGAMLNSGCLNCSCGTCAVEIIKGYENLSPLTDKESAILIEKGKDPAKYRLACCVKILGGEVVINTNY